MTDSLCFDSTVEVIDVCGTQQVAVCLPADWKGEQVTVVRGVAPEGLVPAGDGTYYGPAGVAQAHGMETSQYRSGPWGLAARHLPDLIVLCRPVPAPEPRTERVPWYQAVGRTISGIGGAPLPVTGMDVHRDGSVTIWSHGTAVLPPADGMVEVLVEDDPADTGPADSEFKSDGHGLHSSRVDTSRVEHPADTGPENTNPHTAKVVTVGPVPVDTVDICGARNPWPGFAGSDCIHPPGHRGDHRNGTMVWPPNPRGTQ